MPVLKPEEEKKKVNHYFKAIRNMFALIVWALWFFSMSVLDKAGESNIYMYILVSIFFFFVEALVFLLFNALIKFNRDND